MTQGLRLFLGILTVLVAMPADAQWQWRQGGYLKSTGQLQQYNERDVRVEDDDRIAREDTATLRLELDGRAPAMQLSLHYELLAEFGDAVEDRGYLTERGIMLFEPSRIIPDDETRLMRLRHTVSEGNRHRAVQRLDRASVGTGTMTLSASIGRQVHSWGDGHVFQVHDWLSSGSPLALDREYKAGEDMVYGEYLTEDGGEVQAAGVVRRERATGDVTQDVTTYAVKREWMNPGVELRLLAARHFGQAAMGVGMVGDWQGAVWRMNGALSRTRDGRTVFSGLVNMDRFWGCAGRTCYGFVEYFRNGFGVGDGNYRELDEPLVRRLENGDLFTLGRDYTALGLGIEWFDHVDARIESLWNLNDGSTFNRLWLEYEPRQNLRFSGGLGVASGGRNDEFSGVPLGQGDADQGFSQTLFIRLAGFF